MRAAFTVNVNDFEMNRIAGLDLEAVEGQRHLRGLRRILVDDLEVRAPAVELPDLAVNERQQDGAAQFALIDRAVRGEMIGAAVVGLGARRDGLRGRGVALCVLVRLNLHGAGERLWHAHVAGAAEQCAADGDRAAAVGAACLPRSVAGSWPVRIEVDGGIRVVAQVGDGHAGDRCTEVLHREAAVPVAAGAVGVGRERQVDGRAAVGRRSGVAADGEAAVAPDVLGHAAPRPADRSRQPRSPGSRAGVAAAAPGRRSSRRPAGSQGRSRRGMHRARLRGPVRRRRRR